MRGQPSVKTMDERHVLCLLTAHVFPHVLSCETSREHTSPLTPPPKKSHVTPCIHSGNSHKPLIYMVFFWLKVFKKLKDFD